METFRIDALGCLVCESSKLKLELGFALRSHEPQAGSSYSVLNPAVQSCR